MIDFTSKTKKTVIVCTQKDCQDENCQTQPLLAKETNTPVSLPLENKPKNGRGPLIWLNGFAEAFSQFSAIYPIACFFDWMAQLIDPQNPQWQARGFTQAAEFSPNAFYTGLGLTFVFMLGSAYCHSEMQRLNQLKRTHNNQQPMAETSEPLSLGGLKIFLLLNDIFAHWLAKIGMPIMMVNLYIHELWLRYTLFALIPLIGAAATIAEFVACYVTLLEIQAIETKTAATTYIKPSDSTTFWSLHGDKFNIFSFLVQCCVSYLDNFLVFQQITGLLSVGIILATYPTLSEAIGQYVLNSNKKDSQQHICANSNCSLGSQKTTSWTDFFARTDSEKLLLAGRTVSLANGCIEAGLLLTLLCWQDISPMLTTITAVTFFAIGILLNFADIRNIATEINNYIIKNKQEYLFGWSMFSYNCCQLFSNKSLDKKPLLGV